MNTKGNVPEMIKVLINKLRLYCKAPQCGTKHLYVSCFLPEQVRRHQGWGCKCLWLWHAPVGWMQYCSLDLHFSEGVSAHLDPALDLTHHLRTRSQGRDGTFSSSVCSVESVTLDHWNILYRTARMQTFLQTRNKCLFLCTHVDFEGELTWD